MAEYIFFNWLYCGGKCHEASSSQGGKSQLKDQVSQNVNSVIYLPVLSDSQVKLLHLPVNTFGQTALQHSQE